MKIFVISSLISFIYTALIYFLKPEVTRIQNQQQYNNVQIQRYVYKNNNAPIVMVGSSLAAALNQDFFKYPIYNLAFRGGTSLTGIETIIRSNSKPDYVIIETNIMDKSPDMTSLDNLLNPYMFYSRKYISALQYEYQPINLIISYVYSKFTQDKFAKLKEKPNPSVLRNNISNYVEQRQNIDKVLIKKNIKLLSKKVRDLEKKGIKVFFIEMPTDKAVMDTPRSLFISKSIKKEFPYNKYKWINLPNEHNYETNDGLHLTYGNANIVYNYILSFLNKEINLLPKGKESINNPVKHFK